MAIVTADIVYRLSGGAGNTSPAASLGGAMGTAAGAIIADATLRNLFDDVTGDEAAAGDIEYRGFYVQNAHGSLTLKAPFFWIKTPTTSGSTEFDVALAAEAVGAAMASVANEQTAPTGPVFTRPTTKAGGLAIADIPFGSYKGLWIRRTVTAGAAALAVDAGVIRVEGDTDA